MSIGKWIKILFIFWLTLIQVFAAPKVDPSIAKTIAGSASKMANIIVSFASTSSSKSPMNFLKEIRGQSAYPTRGSRLTALYNAQKKICSTSQAKLQELLNEEMKTRAAASNTNPLSFHRLWLSNQLIVYNVDEALLTKLSSLEELSLIEEDKVLQYEPETKEKKEIDEKAKARLKTMQVGKDPWGIRSMGVEDIWKMGHRGKGIVVGIMDTGVMKSHEALKDNYRASYGWFNPRNVSSVEPYDPIGLGTHAAGIVVGKTHGIGVAPEAQWIACRAVQENSLMAVSDALQCLEWMACPTLPDFTEADCSKAPHVVLSSHPNFLQGTQPSASNINFLDIHIRTMVAENFIPIFAVGDKGPGCSTVQPIASHVMSIGVGSVGETNILSVFSSIGPTKENHIKPDIAAPGEFIYSAYIKSDASYEVRSGTGSAAAHIAGLAALYYAGNTEITVENFESALFKGARPLAGSSAGAGGSSCGGISRTEYPNNYAGYGRATANIFPFVLRSRGSKDGNLLEVTLVFLVIVVAEFIYTI